MSGGQVLDNEQSPGLYGSEHVLSQVPRGAARALYALLEAVPRLDELSAAQEKRARDLAFQVDIGRSLCGETTLLGAGLLGTTLPAVVHVQIDVSVKFATVQQAVHTHQWYIDYVLEAASLLSDNSDHVLLALVVGARAFEWGEGEFRCGRVCVSVSA